MFRDWPLKSVILLLFFSIPLTAAPARPTEIPGEARYDEKYQVWVVDTATSQNVWYPAGKKKAEGGLKQGHRNGPWLFWYENGQKRAEGSYQEGRMEGPWKHYYKSGELQSEGEYRSNTKTGNWNFYFESGKKKSEGAFVGGLKNGPWTEYYPSGGVFFKGQYLANLAHGTWSYFFENGSFFQAGRFTEDVRTGVWKICIAPGGPCGEENYRQSEPPRISNLPKAEDLPGNDVRKKPGDPVDLLDSMEPTGHREPSNGAAPNLSEWDHFK